MNAASTVTRPITSRQRWRSDDPAPELVGDLGPDTLHRRIVIRTKELLGTVYGTLVGVRQHPHLAGFTCVQLYGKRELTIRDDTEVLVLDF